MCCRLASARVELEKEKQHRPEDVRCSRSGQPCALEASHSLPHLFCFRSGGSETLTSKVTMILTEASGTGYLATLHVRLACWLSQVRYSTQDAAMPLALQFVIISTRVASDLLLFLLLAFLRPRSTTLSHATKRRTSDLASVAPCSPRHLPPDRQRPHALSTPPALRWPAPLRRQRTPPRRSFKTPLQTAAGRLRCQR